MIAITNILFSRDSSRNHGHVTQGPFSTLQAYLVPFERDCKHKQFVLDLRLQAYLVPVETEIASIFGPLCYQDGKYIISQSLISLQTYLVPINVVHMQSSPISYRLYVFSVLWPQKINSQINLFDYQYQNNYFFNFDQIKNGKKTNL